MSDPKIGIALGAGGARGLAHFHVLAALDELGIRPHRVSGCSIGAVIGAVYCSGMDAQHCRAYTENLLSRYTTLLAGLWRARANSFQQFMADGGFRLAELNIERLLSELLPDSVAVEFEELVVPLTVGATALHAAEAVNFERGPILPAIAASAALPVAFGPVTIDGILYVDGGFANPLPFELLGDADIIIGSDLSGLPFSPQTRRPSGMQIARAFSPLMQRAVIDEKRKSHRLDICIRPDVGAFGVLDFYKHGDILEQSSGIKDETKFAIAKALQEAGEQGKSPHGSSRTTSGGTAT